VKTKSTRPVNLNLMKMKFPPMAIVSIMHRISGVFLFLLLPLVLYLFHTSLSSELGFMDAESVASGFIVQFLLWVFFSAAGFHLFAGVRHMLMDLGVGEHLVAARRTAYVLMGLEVIVMILIGVWLWG